MNHWKYKIELTGTAFHEFEQTFRVKLPDDLKSFIQETNAAEPEKCRVKINSIERVYGATLSFNKNETEADSVYTAKLAIKAQDFIPFGIDPFGNYFCYCLKTSTISFWDHETGEQNVTEMNINDFVKHLY